MKKKNTFEHLLLSGLLLVTAVFVVLAVHSLFQEGQNGRMAFVITILGILSLLTFAIIYYRKTMADPLKTLIESFDQVAGGDLLHRAEVHASGQIGTLAESFNNMTEKLQDSVAEIRAINIQLDSHSRGLEQRVTTRTRELSEAVEKLKLKIEEKKKAEDKLLEAKMEAESANRAKSQFLANMSHEIRTPMNAIIGMTELVLETQLTPEQEEHVAIVKNSADSLLNLLNDILDFSKIEVGRLDIEPIEFNIRESLSVAMKNISISAHQKHLEVIYHITRDIPGIVIGDPGRLRQIITNLIGNSIKFTSEGVILLSVEKIKDIEHELKPGEIKLHFSISDTGIGIPKDKHDHIFEKFTQKDSSITRRFGGTGLGLAICKQLVKMMHGDISVESPGDLKELFADSPGSTFHFSTIVKMKEGEETFVEPVELKSLKGTPILVVDDNPVNRTVLKETINDWGLEPEFCSCGTDALKMLKNNSKDKRPFKMVLMDVRMPGMDGYETVEHILRDDDIEVKGPQIIILTSSAIKGDGKRCRDLGVAAYLKKPLRHEELLETMLLVMGTPTKKKKAASLITTHSLKENRRKFNILVAEDNRINQKLIKSILEKRDSTVTLVSNGKEAVERFAEEPFDIILMDIQMPEMDGTEATVEIRKIEKKSGAKRIPIVALTAHAMKGDKERFLEAGMDSHVSKPLKQLKLIETIETLVPKKKSIGSTQLAVGKKKTKEKKKKKKSSK
ncbi:MAG: response regulator, partial [bacterium]|nr:response regulator [bacterium]